MKVTAVVICRDEEAAIERCLRSVRFCDEIVVVDSGSTDGTLQRAKGLADRVVEQRWLGYGAQKNMANALASHRWVLSVDADEEVSPALRAEIERAVREPGEAVAFSVPRKTFQFGRWIRYGGWYPDRQIRLFLRENGHWTEGAVHERWLAEGPVGRLVAPLLHYSFDGLTDQLRRYERYALLQAEELRRAKVRPSVVRLFTRPVRKFLESYLWKRGFLDGEAGLVVAGAMAYAAYLKWAILWETSRTPSSQERAPTFTLPRLETSETQQ